MSAGIGAWELERDGAPTLRGESGGEGPPIVLVHGLTATRRYVVHGSRLLARRSFQGLSYDARGHGASHPAGSGGYSYEALADDLGAVVEDRATGARPVLAGHSMGAHTILTLALRDQSRPAGLVLIGPAYFGSLPDEATLREWDELADGLERGGVEGFVAAYDRPTLEPAWREVAIKVARQRLGAHAHPEAVADAIREVPRSQPFDSLDELEFLELPVLVVASHDRADPGHPYAVAEAYAERIPGARLLSEAPDESPLAWQGSKLSAAIADFCETEAVRSRR